MTPYRTNPDDAVEGRPRHLLPSGLVVTTLPLVDQRTDLFARLDRDEAERALGRLGLRLPTLAEVHEIAGDGFWVAPVTLVNSVEDQRLMRTEEYCRRHDKRVMAALERASWNGKQVVSTCGKWHIAGAAPGANRIAGWPVTPGGTFIQKGEQDVHIGESLTDYATLTMGVSVDGSMGPASTWFGERIAGHVLDVARELGAAVQSAAVPSVALLALEIAEREARTVKEATGRNDGPVSKYFAETVRDTLGTPDDWSDDKRTGHADGWEWCAASASWCTWEAYEELRREGYSVPEPPYARRIAVHELVSDARRRGHFHPKGSPGQPRKGDLGIYGRGGGDPTKGDIGHVGRFKTDVDGFGGYVSIDGNAGIAWGERSRSIHDADFKGWISHP